MNPRPPIIVSTLDAARLQALLDQCSTQQQAELNDLQAELVRAQLVEPAQMPADVVTLNSTVTFEIASSAQTFSLTLVHPRDLGDGVGRVSVLAPVGSAANHSPAMPAAAMDAAARRRPRTGSPDGGTGR